MNERRALTERCGESSAEPGDEASLSARVHQWLASGSSALVMVQADDLAFEVNAVNLPGTDTERSNWRRKVQSSIEHLLTGSAGPIIDSVRSAR